MIMTIESIDSLREVNQRCGTRGTVLPYIRNGRSFEDAEIAFAHYLEVTQDLGEVDQALHWVSRGGSFSVGMN